MTLLEIKTIDISLLDDTQWLTENWTDPVVGQTIVGLMKNGVKTDAGSHLPGLVKKLWETNCHSEDKLVLLDDNRRGDRSSWKTDGRIQNNVKSIREILPSGISLYHLGKEGRIVLMPTIADDEFALLPEDKERILGLDLPENVLPFAAWVNFRQVENRVGGNGTTLSSRGSKKTLDLVNCLLENYGKPLTAKAIANSLRWEDAKGVNHYATAAREISVCYPGEIKFTVKVEENKKDFQKSTYFLAEATEEDLEVLVKASEKKESSPEEYPEIHALVRNSCTLDRLRPLNPTEADCDARIGPDNNETTWSDRLSKLRTVERGALEAFRKFKELGIEMETLPKGVSKTLTRIQEVIDEAEKHLINNGGVADTAIQDVISDVNTSVVILTNSDQEGGDFTEAPEEAWKEMGQLRNLSWRLFQTEDFLKGIADDPAREKDVSKWLEKIQDMRAKTPTLDIPFYTTRKDIDVVDNEVERLNEILKISEWFTSFFAVKEPGVFLGRNKVGKTDVNFFKIKTALSEIYKTQNAVNKALADNKEGPSTQALLSVYLNAYRYHTKKALSGGRIRTYQEYFSVADLGNMEYVEFEAVDLGGGNLIPVRVLNKKYKVIHGEIKILTQSGTNQIILGSDELPVIYYDSQIVFNEDKYRNSPVRLLKL